MGLPVDKLSLVLGVLNFEHSFAVPFALQPLALIEALAFLGALALDLVVDPGPLVGVAIEVVVDALAMLAPLHHLPFVPTSATPYLSPFLWMKMPSPW